MKLKKSFLSCKGENKLGAVIGRFVTDAPIKPPSAEGGGGMEAVLVTFPARKVVLGEDKRLI